MNSTASRTRLISVVTLGGVTLTTCLALVAGPSVATAAAHSDHVVKGGPNRVRIEPGKVVKGGPNKVRILPGKVVKGGPFA